MIENFIPFWKSVLVRVWVIADNWHSTVCDFLGANTSQECL